jgi:hypothetical protein
MNMSEKIVKELAKKGETRGRIFPSVKTAPKFFISGFLSL